MTNYNSYQTGRYALVDILYKNIWLNISDESIAHQIRKTFLSKVGLIVYDLEFFKNWNETPPTVDSDCCLNWQLATTIDEQVINQNLVNCTLFETQRTHQSDLLINRPAKTLLTLDRQRELQGQMILYKNLLQKTKLHITTTQTDKLCEVVDFVEQEDLRKQLLDEIHTIFCTEIHTESLEQKLYEFVHRNIGKNSIISITILGQINRTYA
jgi:hypothetical protein